MPNNFIITSIDDGLRLIKINNPSKKNALMDEMYMEVTRILNEDATDDSVVATIITVEGDYYSSGNDFTPFLNYTGSYEQLVVKRVEILKQFCIGLIEYPKILIGVVNGPAVGIAVTTLALFDFVYSSDRATFSTPFVNLGVCPEACSSFLFPRLMGRSRASELLLMGKNMTAEDALKAGLVTEIVPHERLGIVFDSLRKYSKLPLQSVINAKALASYNLKVILSQTNDCECNMVVKCLYSEEFAGSLRKFSQRKNKL